MNAAVVYFSRTGNTQKLAQAIATEAKAPIYELSAAEPSKIANIDVLIFGTPVEGSSPTKEAMAYIDNLPAVTGKKAILFVTYRIFGNERTMKAVEKALAAKGYETILKVSKKGMKPGKDTDFSDVLAKIKTVLL
jgi:flavodoxin